MESLQPSTQIGFHWSSSAQNLNEAHHAVQQDRALLFGDFLIFSFSCIACSYLYMTYSPFCITVSLMNVHNTISACYMLGMQPLKLFLWQCHCYWQDRNSMSHYSLASGHCHHHPRPHRPFECLRQLSAMSSSFFLKSLRDLHWHHQLFLKSKTSIHSRAWHCMSPKQLTLHDGLFLLQDAFDTCLLSVHFWFSHPRV